MSKKATRLKKPDIFKVDLVPSGANQGAAVMLYKSNTDKEGGETKKMSVFEKIGKAMAETMANVAGIDIAKEGAETFGERLIQNKVERLLDNNWWDYTYALKNAVVSVLKDSDLDDSEKKTSVSVSIAEFADALTDLLFNTQVQVKLEKSGKKISAQRVKRMKEMFGNLGKLITETEGTTLADLISELSDDGEDETKKGCKTNKSNEEDFDTMKIDKSKLTPEEIASLEAIEKKAGTPDAAGAPGGEATPVAGAGGETGINKMVDAAVQKATQPLIQTIESLTGTITKMNDDKSVSDMITVAKKYEVLGHKADELGQTLADLKKSSAASYDAMIAALDKSVDVLNANPLFTEIGKSGGIGSADGSWTKIETAASEIMKSDAKLSRQQAIAKACEQHPEFVKEYEEGR